MTLSPKKQEREQKLEQLKLGKRAKRLLEKERQHVRKIERQKVVADNNLKEEGDE